MKMDARELGVLLDHMNPPEYVQWHRKRILTCVEFLQSVLPLRGKKTLDLGHDVHVGGLLSHLGCDLRGNVAPVELAGQHESARDRASYTAPNGTHSAWELDAFDFEKPFPYQDASFDLVTTMEVIEHVSTSPRAFIQEVKRVLVPGGHFFVATPNAACWTKILRTFGHGGTYDAKPYSQNFGPRHAMCHVYEYTPWELKELLKSEGFEVVNLSTWDAYDLDPRGIKQAALKIGVTIAMILTGHFRFAVLMHKNRGHQMGIVARLKPVTQ